MGARLYTSRSFTDRSYADSEPVRGLQRRGPTTARPPSREASEVAAAPWPPASSPTPSSPRASTRTLPAPAEGVRRVASVGGGRYGRTAVLPRLRGHSPPFRAASIGSVNPDTTIVSLRRPGREVSIRRAIWRAARLQQGDAARGPEFSEGRNCCVPNGPTERGLTAKAGRLPLGMIVSAHHDVVEVIAVHAGTRSDGAIADNARSKGRP